MNRSRVNRFDEPMLYETYGRTPPLRSGAPFLGGVSRERAVATGSHIGLWALMAIAILVSSAALTLGIITFVRNDNRHKGLSSRIHTAQGASASVGFSAFKNTTQVITDGLVTDVNEWEIGEDYPSYDNTYGGFNSSSGVFTVAHGGAYIFVTTACFNASAGGVREVHLVTSGDQQMAAVSRVSGDVTSGGAQCVSVSQNQWLPAGAEVFVLVLTDSGADEAVVAGSLFSGERIAV